MNAMTRRQVLTTSIPGAMVATAAGSIAQGATPPPHGADRMVATFRGMLREYYRFRDAMDLAHERTAACTDPAAMRADDDAAEKIAGKFLEHEDRIARLMTSATGHSPASITVDGVTLTAFHDEGWDRPRLIVSEPNRFTPAPTGR